MHGGPGSCCSLNPASARSHPGVPPRVRGCCRGEPGRGSFSHTRTLCSEVLSFRSRRQKENLRLLTAGIFCCSTLMGPVWMSPAVRLRTVRVKLLTDRKSRNALTSQPLPLSAPRPGTSISYSPNRKAEPREFTPRGSNHTQSGKERAWPRSPNCGRGAADGRADRRTQDGPSGAGRKPQPALTHRPQRPAGPCGTLPPLRWEGKQ